MTDDTRQDQPTDADAETAAITDDPDAMAAIAEAVAETPPDPPALDDDAHAHDDYPHDDALVGGFANPGVDLGYLEVTDDEDGGDTTPETDVEA